MQFTREKKIVLGWDPPHVGPYWDGLDALFHDGIVLAILNHGAYHSAPGEEGGFMTGRALLIARECEGGEIKHWDARDGERECWMWLRHNSLELHDRTPSRDKDLVEFIRSHKTVARIYKTLGQISSQASSEPE